MLLIRCCTIDGDVDYFMPSARNTVLIGGALNIANLVLRDTYYPEYRLSDLEFCFCHCDDDKLEVMF